LLQGLARDVIGARWRDPKAVTATTSPRHPFVDGNKRVAVTVTAAFLKVNGYRLEFDDLEACVETGSLTVAAL